MRYLFILSLWLGIAACSISNKYVRKTDPPFKIKVVSDDKSYGYTPENPIMVGGAKDNKGPLNERRYLNSLAGPNGEEILYYREGSCCPFESKNGYNGWGMLDEYKVTWKGRIKKVSIYINMYDADSMLAPKGFTIKN